MQSPGPCKARDPCGTPFFCGTLFTASLGLCEAHAPQAPLQNVSSRSGPIAHRSDATRSMICVRVRAESCCDVYGKLIFSTHALKRFDTQYHAYMYLQTAGFQRSVKGFVCMAS